MYSEKFYEAHNNPLTKFTKEINDFMKEINNKFEWYEELFLCKHKGRTTEEQMIEELRCNLNSLNGSELDELNNICKMFSKANCSWSAYEMGRIVHNEIMKIFFSSAT